MSLETEMVRYDMLSEDEKLGQPNNGAGADMATYLRIYHNGNLIDTYSDAMEPEDARFFRDLSWIEKAIGQAYRLGLEDGNND